MSNIMKPAPHPFSPDDFTLGFKVMCVFSKYPEKIGRVYEVTETPDSIGLIKLVNVNLRTNTLNWSVDAFNSFKSNVFWPYDKLTDKEHFLFRISGKLP